MQETEKPVAPRPRKKAKKRNRGKQPFKPNAGHRKTVSLLAAAGISEPVIAADIGCCQNTLRKYFAYELATGNEVELARNIRRIQTAASGKRSNVTAMKYLDLVFRKPRLPEITKDADLVDAPMAAAPPAPKPPKLGKKEEAQVAALTAGEGSQWGDDLKVPTTPLN